MVEHSCEWKHQVNLSKPSGVAVREVVREVTEISGRSCLHIMDKLSTWSPGDEFYILTGHLAMMVRMVVSSALTARKSLVVIDLHSGNV